ncbi:hypothetical protein FK220_014795 [Flavobacteriaceae bacterium TP-CH-4]|uniref:Uncharacterized protein n=1 Tax=Pelagihabitans pacificus TaxID=2696054 RepID=A0A967AUH7_9FLAO|nr:DUF6428 family protein [Pelagihabitans pacificus]NHF60621.1 hypothetical protein [Pelagihabitans pacificus]
MKTNEFLALLKEHPNKDLIFEYAHGKQVGANYHITEVKNVTIDSVDCGTKTDFWKETIIQLWESPDEHESDEYMSAFKALGILNKVDRIKPMEKEVEVKFEYSNPTFHTAQLFVNDVSVHDNRIMITLGVEQTNCKAREICGVPVQAAAEACCSPDAGCC